MYFGLLGVLVGCRVSKCHRLTIVQWHTVCTEFVQNLEMCTYILKNHALLPFLQKKKHIFTHFI